MNVWLSYSNEDIQIVNQIRDKLTQIRNIQIFTADLDIRPGDLYIGKIVELIKNSQIFLIFVSKNSEKSRYFSSEVALILSEWEKDPNKKVIPIILDKESIIPPFLNRFAGLDLSGPRKISDNISLLIDSIETDSKITLSNDEINSYYNDYIRNNYEILEQQKKEYKKKSIIKSSKLYFYLIIYFYVLIFIFSFFFLTEITPVNSFTSELFLLLLGLLLGFVFGIWYSNFIDHFKNKIKRSQ